jgi:hypothetical protein
LIIEGETLGQDEEEANTTAPSEDAQLLVDRAKVAETTREEMEVLAGTVRDLVLRQPPIQLLGYLLAQFHMVMMLTPAGSEGVNRRSNLTPHRLPILQAE